MDVNYLLNVDCLVGMPTIKDKSIDLIICDPPYGCTPIGWDKIIPIETLWAEYNRIIKDNGVIILFGNEPFSSFIRTSNIQAYKYDYKWVKPNSTTPHLAKKQPMRRYEDIMVFYNNKPTYNPQMNLGTPYKWNSKRSKGEASNIKFESDKPIVNIGERYPTNILEFKQERGLHPTQKPVELLEFLIKTHSNVGDVILDNCMGSGSTIIASINTNRKYIGIEMNEDIFDVANKRISKHIEQKGENK